MAGPFRSLTSPTTWKRPRGSSGWWTSSPCEGCSSPGCGLCPRTDRPRFTWRRRRGIWTWSRCCWMAERTPAGWTVAAGGRLTWCAAPRIRLSAGIAALDFQPRHLALPRHLLLKGKPLSSLQAPTEAIRQRLRWASGDVIAAASAGSLEGVRLALARGGSPSERDQAGFTPLHHAALVGEVSVVHELLASGSDANARTKARGMESAPCHLRCCSLAATSACGAPVIPEDG